MRGLNGMKKNIPRVKNIIYVNFEVFEICKIFDVNKFARRIPVYEILRESLEESRYR